MKFRYGRNRHNKTVSFKGIVSGIFNELDIKDDFFLETLRNEWNTIVGEILSSHSIPEKIFKSTLYIAVDHSVYANELSMNQNKIVSYIKENISPNVIRSLRFEVKRLTWKDK